MARKSTRFIIVHCSATPPSMDIGAAKIDRWHRARGWRKIGYHYVITRDGGLEGGRAIDEVGAHAAGHNHHSLGVCLIGGVEEGNVKSPENNFTPEQFDTLKGLLGVLHHSYPGAAVIGHNSVSIKACPSFDVPDWLRSVGLDELNVKDAVDTCPACGQALP